MPSQQQLPKNSRIATLPEDLRLVAERLLREKFKVPEEPEVLGQNPMQGPNVYGPDLQYRRLRFRVVPRQHVTRYGVFGNTNQPMPQYFELACGPYDPPDQVDYMLHRQLQSLEAQYGVPFDAIRIEEGARPW